MGRINQRLDKFEATALARIAARAEREAHDNVPSEASTPR